MPKTTVPWNEQFYDEFCRKAMLNTDEREVLRCRIMGYSITQIAMCCNMSASKVSRIVKDLRNKYDAVQKMFPDTLPIRRETEQERWQDTH